MTAHFYAFSRLRDKAGEKILRRREFTITFAGVEINRKVRVCRIARRERTDVCWMLVARSSPCVTSNE
jgi:hypothetical protein